MSVNFNCSAMSPEPTRTPVKVVYVVMVDDDNECCPGNFIYGVYENEEDAEAVCKIKNTPTDPTKPWTSGPEHWVDKWPIIYALPVGHGSQDQ